MAHIQENYPSEGWIHSFTDGSAQDATKNGGGGIYIQFPHQPSISSSIQTGKTCSNYKAEIKALEAATEILSQAPKDSDSKIVFLTDALSVLKALQADNEETISLSLKLSNLSKDVQKLQLQWIPSHCNIVGNEKADILAKEGSRGDQTEHPSTYQEARTVIKNTLSNRWRDKHPKHNHCDSIYKLTHKEQTIIFRLRTEHCRLRYHLHKMKLVPSAACPCGHITQTVEHVLQHCPLYHTLRTNYWPTPTSLEEKLYGDDSSLSGTAGFIGACGVDV